MSLQNRGESWNSPITIGGRHKCSFHWGFLNQHLTTTGCVEASVGRLQVGEAFTNCAHLTKYTLWTTNSNCCCFYDLLVERMVAAVNTASVPKSWNPVFLSCFLMEVKAAIMRLQISVRELPFTISSKSSFSAEDSDTDKSFRSFLLKFCKWKNYSRNQNWIS